MRRRALSNRLNQPSARCRSCRRWWRARHALSLPCARNLQGTCQRCSTLTTRSKSCWPVTTRCASHPLKPPERHGVAHLRSARYWVRLVGEEDSTVQLFAVAASSVPEDGPATNCHNDRHDHHS